MLYYGIRRSCCMMLLILLVASPSSEAAPTRLRAIRVNPEGKSVEYGEIRESSTLESRILGRVSKGVELHVSEYEYGWYGVYVPSLKRSGWIHVSDALPLFRGEDSRLMGEVRRILAAIDTPSATVQERLAGLRSVLSLRRRAMDFYMPADAAMLMQLADLNRMLGNIRNARGNVIESVKATRLLYRNGTYEHANRLLKAAEAMAAMRDRETALEYLDDASSAFRQVQKVSPTEDALFEMGYGSTLLHLGEFRNARSRLSRAAGTLSGELVAARRGARGDFGETSFNELLSFCFHKLGIIQERFGYFIEASRFFRLAYQCAVDAYGENHTQVANIIMSYGVVSDADDALTAFQKAYQIYLRVGPSYSEGALLCQRHLAVASLQLQRYDDAIKGLESLLKVRQEHGHGGAARVGEIHALLAWALLHKGDVNRAETQIEMAQRLRSTTKFPIDVVHAEILLEQGQLRQAAQAARTAFEQLSDRGTALRLDLDTPLSRTLVATGQHDLASRVMLKLHRSGHRPIGNILAQLSAPEQQRRLVQHHTMPLMRTLAYLRRATDNNEVAKVIAELLINGKGLTLEALALQRLMSRRASNAQQIDHSQQLAAVRRRIAGLALSASTAVRNELEKLQREEEQLSSQLASSVNRTAEYEPKHWVELREVQLALHGDEVFIDFFKVPVISDAEMLNRSPKWDGFRYFACVIPSSEHQDQRVEIVEIGDADTIDSLIVESLALFEASSLRQQLTTYGERAVTEDADRLLLQLGKLLWEPVARHVPVGDKVIVSPDGALWQVSWPALVLDDGSYLVESYSIGCVNAGRDIPYPRNPFHPSSGAVVFADAAFDDDILRDAVDQGKVAARSGRGQTLARLPRAVGRLPYTRAEAELVAPSIEQCAGARPELLFGEEATEEAFRSLKSPHILVLATHGFFLPRVRESTRDSAELGHWSSYADAESDPLSHPMMRSGILLAGCNVGVRDGTGVGVITAFEVLDVDLRGTELVVLSACESGRGTVQVGEGVAGLTQAFQVAGARNVLASLWPVDDRETVKLMQGFFESYSKSFQAAEAMRAAQLDRIRNRRDKYGSAHPYFWAAFQTIGR